MRALKDDEKLHHAVQVAVQKGTHACLTSLTGGENSVPLRERNPRWPPGRLAMSCEIPTSAGLSAESRNLPGHPSGRGRDGRLPTAARSRSSVDKALLPRTRSSCCTLLSCAPPGEIGISHDAQEFSTYFAPGALRRHCSTNQLIFSH